MSFFHRHCSYVDQGRYAPMLERWFAAYGRDRVHVEISEEMYADPQATVDRVTDRLGIRRHRLHDTAAHNAEPARGPRRRRRGPSSSSGWRPAVAGHRGAARPRRSPGPVPPQRRTG